MTVLVIPRHLETTVLAAIKREIAWHDQLTPQSRDLWFGPLADEKVSVIIGAPASAAQAEYAWPDLQPIATMPSVSGAVEDIRTVATELEAFAKTEEPHVS